MAAVGADDLVWLLGTFALLVAFLSASQDIVFDAYRTDLLRTEERGIGAGVWVNGYRIALVVAGSLALVLADRIGWRETYLAMAGLMGVGIVAILLSPEPDLTVRPPGSLAEAIWGPIQEFFSRRAAVGLLALIVLYKIGDAFAAALMTAFLIGGIGFSSSEVGLMKTIALAMTMLGALGGGVAMVKLGLFRALLLFGALQALSNLSFMALAWAGKSYSLLALAVVIENLTGGMGTAAFLALIMSLCDHRYTATQFALLSSLEALGRVLLGRPAAELVEAIGWPEFFFVTFLAALPGLGLLWRLKDVVALSSSSEKGNR